MRVATALASADAHGGDGSAGARIAQILARTWRESVTPLGEPGLLIDSCDERLLVSGCGALVWRRVRDAAWRRSPNGDRFRQAYRVHALQASIHERNIALAARALRDVEIEPILAKGWSIAARYPEPGLRPYGDIDFCVPNEQRTLAMAAVLDATQSLRRDARLTSFRADVQSSFHDMPDRSYAELRDRSRMATLAGAEIRVMGDEDQLRLICLHFLRHSGWRPLWLCDIALFAESLPPAFDWDACLRGRKAEAERVACALGLAHALLGAALPDFPLARRAQRLPRWLVSAVLAQWSKPHSEYPIVATARPTTRRGAISWAIRSRWPTPIEASVRIDAPFNDAPRLPFQLADSLWRAGQMARRSLPF